MSFEFLSRPICPALGSGERISPFLDHGYYTRNLYVVDLADPSGIAQPATEEEWRSARVVPVRREWPTPWVASLGFRFATSGDHKNGYLLSPARSVLMMLS